ncbi:MAG TPA: hypothetical protein VK866_07710 [Acidimicrobiales bacterium]|nr:hypothetical protein [Acidimicrobiales bacterium]
MSWNEPPADAAPVSDATIDRLAAVAADLDRVEAALARLDDGSYGTCVVTGEPLPDELLAADPTADRLPHAH